MLTKGLRPLTPLNSNGIEENTHGKKHARNATLFTGPLFFPRLPFTCSRGREGGPPGNEVGN